VHSNRNDGVIARLKRKDHLQGQGLTQLRPIPTAVRGHAKA
jgi:hypothetical protein